MDELAPQISKALQCVEKLWQDTEQLSLPQKQAFLDTLNELSQAVNALQVEAEKMPASNEEFLATRQALEAERQRSQELEKQVEEGTTALSQANEQLTHLNTELERLNQLKDNFLSTVSHDLRTPITNMKMAIHMLSKTLEQSPSLCAEMSNPEAQRSKIARYFQILLEECDRESNLIDNLLDWQQLDEPAP